MSVLPATLFLLNKHSALGILFLSIAILYSSLAFVFHTLSRKADNGSA